MAEISWIIHGVTDCQSAFPGKEYIGNFHTHGLNEFKGQKELCVVLALPPEVVGKLLNNMGIRVAEGETVFNEGIRTDILKQEMRVEFISFDDDPTLYVILPDSKGKLPNEKGCKKPFKFQYEYAKLIHDDEQYV